MQRAGGRQPSERRVLRVQAGLDGVTAQWRRALERQRTALGHDDLQPDQVEHADDALGDRVLDLQTGVHLEEEELAGRRDQELDRAGADVTDGLRDRDRRVAELARMFCVTAGDGVSSMIFCCRRWIEHSRSPNVTTLPSRSAMTCTSMWRARSTYALAEDGAVAERRGRLAPGRCHGFGQGVAVADDPHAAPAAAGRRLDHDRELGRRQPGRSSVAQQRDAGLGHACLGLQLRAHHRDRLRVRADPGQTGVGDGFGEVGPLREEAVARVHRVRARLPGGVDEQIAAQVGRGRGVARQVHGVVGLCDVRRALVGVGVDGDRLDAHRAAGGEDASGDLAAVRDQ